MNELALFAGAGGGILGGALLGWTTVGAVEINEHARRVLLARQQDGLLPRFPLWDDVQTFDGQPWRGLVDIVTGGFPCQDISAAGKGAGIDGERSGLWRHMHRIISEIRPTYALVENSPLLISRGLARVLADLAASGYDAVWDTLSASGVGAPHRRRRLWLLARLADPHMRRDAGRARLHANIAQTPCGQDINAGRIYCHGRQWWSLEPGICRVAHGVADRLERLRAIGNGQVPSVAASAFLYLSNLFNNLTINP